VRFRKITLTLFILRKASLGGAIVSVLLPVSAQWIAYPSLTKPEATWILAGFRAVELLGHEPSIPGQDRIRLRDAGHLPQRLG